MTRAVSNDVYVAVESGSVTTAAVPPSVQSFPVESVNDVVPGSRPRKSGFATMVPPGLLRTSTYQTLRFVVGNTGPLICSGCPELWMVTAPAVTIDDPSCVNV